MKKLLFILMTLTLLFALFSCGECEHEWKEATCQSPKTCSLCGETEGEKADHAYGEWSTVKASTCTEKGSQTRSCSCGAVDTAELPLAAHETETVAAKPSTCKEQGYDAHEACKNCDYTTKTLLPLDDHDTVSHEGKAPSCTEAGWQAYETCNNCDYTTFVSIPETHDTVQFEGKTPTCKTTGWKPYEACKNCSYTTFESLPYAQHETTSYKGKPSTCQTKGYADYVTCKNCSYSTYQLLPLSDHSCTETVTPPTCEGEGYTTYECIWCDYEKKDNYVEPHGHGYTTWYVLSPITSTSNGGTKRYDCINCMIPKDEPIGVISSGYFGGVEKTETLTQTATYKVYEDGTLKIEGTGVTFDPNWKGEHQPYVEYRDFIKRAIVGEGITYIQGGAFAYMSNLEEYQLPSTLYHMTGNTFMQSFKKGITEFTVPANVQYIGICIAGPYSSNVTNTALFTDIFIENPNISFHAPSKNKAGELYISFNSFVKYNPDLRIYSYGTSNNVKTYCDTYGLTYIDLNTIATGTVDNLSYKVLNGKMLLSAKEPAKPVTLPTSQPWLNKLSKTDVTSIEITAPITDIPASYFKDYTALTTVTLPTTVKTIGSEAFATTSPTEKALTLTTYDALTSVANDFLKNRKGVTVNGIFGTVLDNFSQTGVTLNLKKSIKILLIGNSLSQDAADYTSNNQPSQLYNIIKAMAGEDCYVKIGALCAGAKTAGWHATMAETNAAQYQFNIISDDTNGLWTKFSNEKVTSVQGLTADKWDYITIQPYGSEALTGIGSTGDSDTNPKNAPVKAEKFYPLSASLPYLLDHINTYCPDAKVYYYMTWSNYHNESWDSSDDLALNGAEDEFVYKRLPIARAAMAHKGTKSGKGFDGLIAGGTAIQNARSTYLGTQFYTSYNKPPAANKPDITSWIGLQRDDVHLALSTGRYIVGLAFAEVLVPESYRVPNYTLPDIAPNINGALPKSHTELAQLCVQKMLETSKLTGSDQYKVTKLTGYETEPS